MCTSLWTAMLAVGRQAYPCKSHLPLWQCVMGPLQSRFSQQQPRPTLNQRASTAFKGEQASSVGSEASLLITNTGMRQESLTAIWTGYLWYSIYFQSCCTMFLHASSHESQSEWLLERSVICWGVWRAICSWQSLGFCRRIHSRCKGWREWYRGGAVKGNRDDCKCDIPKWLLFSIMKVYDGQSRKKWFTWFVLTSI